MNYKSLITAIIKLPTSSLFVCLICVPFSAVNAQENYAAFELNRDNNWDTLVTQDMDGDGLSDLVFSHFDKAVGREIHIHKQRNDGSFSSQPQRIEIKKEIIAVGFADLRNDPGTELLLFASSGVFSLSTGMEGYAGNLKPLLQWELIATVPNSEQVLFLNPSIDINGDGFVDLLLPGRETYGLFLGGANESFTLLSQFGTASESANTQALRQTGVDANIGINAQEGVSLKFEVESQSVFSNFVEQWDDETEQGTLLRSENWMPNALLTQLNSDSLLDVVYLNQGPEGLGQLNVHFQNAGGFNEKPSWQGSIDVRGELKLTDINGDDIADLVKIEGDGNNWTASFYKNTDGNFNLTQPSQIMRFSGYDLRLNFIRLNPTEKPILSANYYTIPVVDAIRNASLNRTQLLFNYDDENSTQLFNRRPDAKLEETFSAANVRGLSEQLSLDYDVDGNGKRDALYITENGTIAAKNVAADLSFADEPFWEYVASNTVFEFEVLKLNADDLPDLILKHGNTSTVLVALP